MKARDFLTSRQCFQCVNRPLQAHLPSSAPRSQPGLAGRGASRLQGPLPPPRHSSHNGHRRTGGSEGRALRSPRRPLRPHAHLPTPPTTRHVLRAGAGGGSGAATVRRVLAPAWSWPPWLSSPSCSPWAGSTERPDQRPAHARRHGHRHGQRLPGPPRGQRQQRRRLHLPGHLHPRRPPLHREHPGRRLVQAGHRPAEPTVSGDPALLEPGAQVSTEHASGRVFILPAVLAAVFVALGGWPPRATAAPPGSEHAALVADGRSRAWGLGAVTGACSACSSRGRTPLARWVPPRAGPVASTPPANLSFCESR